MFRLLLTFIWYLLQSYLSPFINLRIKGVLSPHPLDAGPDEWERNFLPLFLVNESFFLDYTPKFLQKGSFVQEAIIRGGFTLNP